MTRDSLRERIAIQLHANVQITRSDIFGSKEPTARPVNLPADADVMFAGYVGRRYRTGNCVLLAINPGGGGDAYTQRTPEDEVFYPLLHDFKNSAPHQVMAAFESVNRAFPPIVRGWNLWRILQPVLEALGCELEDVAYLNAVPYRTKRDKTPAVDVIRTAWNMATGPTIELLEPSIIVAVGKKAGFVLEHFYNGPATTVCIPRTIGDSYVSDEAHVVLRQIRDRRTRA